MNKLITDEMIKEADKLENDKALERMLQQVKRGGKRVYATNKELEEQEIPKTSAFYDTGLSSKKNKKWLYFTLGFIVLYVIIHILALVAQEQFASKNSEREATQTTLKN